LCPPRYASEHVPAHLIQFNHASVPRRSTYYCSAYETPQHLEVYLRTRHSVFVTHVHRCANCAYLAFPARPLQAALVIAFVKFARARTCSIPSDAVQRVHLVRAVIYHPHECVRQCSDRSPAICCAGDPRHSIHTTLAIYTHILVSTIRITRFNVRCHCLQVLKLGRLLLSLFIFLAPF
jgi:hypothetical protein